MNKHNSLPVIRQVQLSECGHVCIAMVSAYHGHHIDLQSLRAIQEPTINGSTLLHVMQILEQLKFQTRAIRVDVKALEQVQCPAILHWNMNHFVVLKSMHSNHAIIHDPSLGKRKVSLNELSNAFTGIVLEVEKAPDFTPIQSAQKLRFLDILKGIEGLKSSLIVLLLLSFTIEVFALINPIFMQYITDNVLGSSSLNNLYVVASGFIFLICCHTGVEYLRSHFTIFLTNTISEYFSSGVMSHLLKLPFEYFERRHKGDILSRFHSINEIQSKITTDSINTLLDGIVILLVLAIMIIYSPGLTALILLSLGLYFTLRLLSFNHVKNHTEISIAEHAKQSSKFLEAIQSMIAIKLYSKESSVFREWKNVFIKGMNADMTIARANVFYQILTLFLFNIENILVITLGASLVIKNHYSLGMLLAFLAYRQIFLTKTTAFIQKIFEYRLVSIQMDRVSDILLHPVEAEDNNALIKQNITGDLKVEHVTYQYPGAQQPILANINLHIQKNEKVVITGPSGVGKTTLLKILLGLIQPTQGKILIDGVPIALLGIKKYRSICASVMQDDSLISGSILDNIAFMDAKIDLDKVYQEANFSRADLARELNVSEANVSRIVSAHFGKSLPQLINELRIRDSLQLLEQTDAGMQIIAEQVGFSSLPTFNRVFKDVMNVSPSEYRQAKKQVILA